MKQQHNFKKKIKRIRPFLEEFIIFLMILLIFYYCLFCTGMITIKWTVFTYLCTFTVLLWLLKFQIPFVVFNLFVIADLISDSFALTESKFIEQHPFKASSLLMRRKTNDMQYETVYFKVEVENEGIHSTFTSSAYFELEPGKKYQFLVGKNSGVIIDVLGIDSSDM